MKTRETYEDRRTERGDIGNGRTEREDIRRWKDRQGRHMGIEGQKGET